MEIIDTALIERIRKALIKRYDRDQQIQQMIEEIGAEEGLNETELARSEEHSLNSSHSHASRMPSSA